MAEPDNSSGGGTQEGSSGESSGQDTIRYIQPRDLEEPLSARSGAAFSFRLDDRNNLRFHVQLHTNAAAEASADVMILKAAGGGFEQKVPLSKGRDVGRTGWVEVSFTQVPKGQKLDLLQDPQDGNDPYYLLSDMTFEEIRDGLAD